MTLSLTTSIRKITFDSPKIMGILNVTPDSFYDGGTLKDDRDFLVKAEHMLAAGADILDVGAVSTRPGAAAVSDDEELRRLLPVVEALARQFPKAVLSVDTYRSVVAREAIGRGAHIINDISGGKLDAGMFDLVAELQVCYVLMHMQGSPETMQQAPTYVDVLMEVKHFLKMQLHKLAQKGVVNNVVIDPGFGFGKTAAHNFQLLKGLRSLKDLGFPVLAGVSRKSMINRVLGTNPGEALIGTTALHAMALMNGADILRVHDVPEARQVLELFNFYQSV